MSDIDSIMQSRLLLQELLLALPSIYIVFAVSGTYLWEFLTSLDFEWSFITRRKLFTWPMISYFTGRYLALCAVCLAIYGNSAPAKIDVVEFNNYSAACDAGITGGRAVQMLLIFASNGTNAFASLNLAIRAMAIWSFNRKVVVLLIVLLIGQWAVIIAEVAMCSQLNLIANDIPRASLIWGAIAYTLALDVLVFILTASKIRRVGSRDRTRLLNRILKDGLFYFLLVITVNVTLMATVEVVGLMNAFPSGVLASMVSNRLVRRVSNFSTTAPAVYLVSEDTFAFQPAPTKHIDLEGDLLSSP